MKAKFYGNNGFYHKGFVQELEDHHSVTDMMMPLLIHAGSDVAASLVIYPGPSSCST